MVYQVIVLLDDNVQIVNTEHLDVDFGKVHEHFDLENQ